MIEIICKKIVHPKSKKMFSKETIAQALKEIHFNVQFNQEPKKQAMQAIHVIEQYYNVQRTGKLIKIKTTNTELLNKLKKDLNFETIQEVEDGSQLILVKPEYSQIIF